MQRERETREICRSDQISQREGKCEREKVIPQKPERFDQTFVRSNLREREKPEKSVEVIRSLRVRGREKREERESYIMYEVYNCRQHLCCFGLVWLHQYSIVHLEAKT